MITLEELLKWKRSTKDEIERAIEVLKNEKINNELIAFIRKSAFKELDEAVYCSYCLIEKKEDFCD